MDKDAILAKVREETHRIYLNVSHELPFHGWHHIEFVRKHALRFCDELNADPFLVEIAAYVHDLNYVAKVELVEGGKDLRLDVLTSAGLESSLCNRIESIVKEADIASRKEDTSNE